jgi:hypothetical protein
MKTINEKEKEEQEEEEDETINMRRNTTNESLHSMLSCRNDICLS